MAPFSLEVTGQVQTHPSKPLLPLWSWLPGQRACSGIRAAVPGGKGARGGLPPAATSQRLRISPDGSSLEYFPQGAERHARPAACLPHFLQRGIHLVLGPRPVLGACRHHLTEIACSRRGCCVTRKQAQRC